MSHTDGHWIYNGMSEQLPDKSPPPPVDSPPPPVGSPLPEGDRPRILPENEPVTVTRSAEPESNIGPDSDIFRSSST